MLKWVFLFSQFWLIDTFIVEIFERLIKKRVYVSFVHRSLSNIRSLYK